VRYRFVSTPGLTEGEGNAVITYNYNRMTLLGRSRRKGKGARRISLSARTTVAIWKQPYAPGNPPLGTFSIERAAELTGLSAVWLGFVLLHSKTAAGVWDTPLWHIEKAAQGQPGQSLTDGRKGSTA
jgi:hypothetical protein